ncbi:ABC-F family ATP-binding cassette domain-containing protein [Culicoidibacter larvae]|uniref:ABC-F type ribosomal protection protein n=1 Tax=Culicoidibacter larvae TaxID=2579976 RepID=A0A5R8QAP4_9FIRM|nr:ABC-F type ribosomal protection protein [Culicoidibacter larvae]TLG72950.1 ABC-F type ribosomal protection protein [Culicoidibacter larvae]
MIVLSTSKLTKAIGTDVIIEDIQLELQDGERIALVGANGAGKSTLLRILAGLESYTSGTISQAKNTTLGYLAQEEGLVLTNTIWQEAYSVFEQLRVIEAQLHQIALQMSDEAVYSDADKLDKVAHQYERLREEFEQKGGYQYEAKIRSILHGFGFFEADYDKLIDTLSGGQKTRLALAKLLLAEPDILLLDEPTNHLDIATLDWLENYLRGYRGAILIVSHDRYFLDRLAQYVYEIENHKINRFVGNYTAYTIEKEARFEQQVKEYQKQQTDIKKLEEFIARNLVRASTTKRAQSRRKKLEKMDRLDRPSILKTMRRIEFDVEKQSGKDVLGFNNIKVGVDGTTLFSVDEFQVHCGDSIAFIGRNGIGKSTFLKTIVGILPLISGEIKYGANVELGYYDQEHQQMVANKTVLNELWDAHPLMDEKDIRGTLGLFLFHGEDCFKKVKSLSGGEKSRLALAKLLLQKANTLILDEPTNHLDLNSKSTLEDALIDYEGTQLFVSHDRYFINRVATQIVEITEDGWQIYIGDYDYYLEKQAQQQEAVVEVPAQKEKAVEVVAAAPTPPPTKKKVSIYTLTKIETEIHDTEQEIEEVKAAQLLPENYHDARNSAALLEQLDDLEIKLDKLMTEWSELQE